MYIYIYIVCLSCRFVYHFSFLPSCDEYCNMFRRATSPHLATFRQTKHPVVPSHAGV